ncbi:MAG TPA: hypothetical protein VFQ44_21850 [Streptosporangiaceae bacterium]|nr:hypothetical protein [Streptosporangiaceae bacterium]
MNEEGMERELGRLLNAVIGEPPHHVSDGAVRHRAARTVRRRVTAIAGTAALAVAGTVVAAVSADATGPGTSATSGLRAGEPRFYFNQTGDPYSNLSGSVTALRNSSTGAITSRVHCPGAKSFAESAAAADPHTFFVVCGTKRSFWNSSVYRFSVTSSGGVSNFHLVPGGKLSGLSVGIIAASAGGSEWAATAISKKSGHVEVLVANAATGHRSIWQSTRLMPDGSQLTPEQPSFARQGRTLAVLVAALCHKGLAHADCKAGGEMLTVPAAKGGQLASGRLIFTRAQLPRSAGHSVDSAIISPDASSALVAMSGSHSGLTVLKVPVSPGKVPTVEFRSTRRSNGWLSFSQDPASGSVLVEIGFSARQFQDGWLHNHKITPLRSPNLYNRLLVW